jgi:regulator of cell morphogenesis and NO signaling
VNAQATQINFNEYKNKTLSEIVTNNYHTSEVFEKYNLDFCCRGNKSFEEACNEKGLELNTVFTELEQVHKIGASQEHNYDEWELDFLIEYIINNHHTYVSKMIPVIADHCNKVVAAHGEDHPEMNKIAEIFAVIYKDLKQHMLKEEQILFPFIRQVVNAKKNNSETERPYFGSVQNPIRMMEAEHEHAGDGFQDIKRLSNNFSVPEDGCETCAVLYKELKEFEEDLHKHIHLENNILFPKAIELESEML